jgi:membrane-associated protease RseP (regulator of RpoE activity)
MRKIALLVAGLALAGAATASAQQSKTAAPRPGYIGVSFRGESFYVVGPGAENTAQVVVRDVSKGSPADKAGVKAGDEITRINGMSPANGKFGAVARTLTEGDTVALRIKRDGKEREFTVIAAARPEGYAGMMGDRTIIITADSVRGLMRDFMGSARIHLDTMRLPRVWMNGDSGNFNIRIERFGGKPGDTLFFGKDTVMLRHFRNGAPEAGELLRHFEGELGPGAIFRSMELGSRAIAGAEFTDLDPAMKTYFGTDRGLLTLRVAAETPAARAGLMAGDIIVKANGRAVTRVAELRNVIFAHPETLKLEILRKGDTRTLEVQIRRKGTE